MIQGDLNGYQFLRFQQPNGFSDNLRQKPLPNTNRTAFQP